ncbi:MAG: hypothetical protein ABIM74_06985, partial [candidate division WOR-3 bacterium]
MTDSLEELLGLKIVKGDFPRVQPRSFPDQVLTCDWAGTGATPLQDHHPETLFVSGYPYPEVVYP